MSPEYPSFEAERVKHLEMVQAVVARLATDSFLVKGWALTVAGVFFGLAINSHECGLALVAAVTTVFFWALDTYFLRAERHFRVLYDRVRDRSIPTEPFFMAATTSKFRGELSPEKRASLTYLDVATSWTLLVFYGGLIVTAVIISLVAN